MHRTTITQDFECGLTEQYLMQYGPFTSALGLDKQQPRQKRTLEWVNAHFMWVHTHYFSWVHAHFPMPLIVHGCECECTMTTMRLRNKGGVPVSER